MADINEVYDSNFSCLSDDDEIDYLYNEVYDSLVKDKKYLKNSLTKKLQLHERIKLLEKENNDLKILVEKLITKNKTCNQYETYKAKVIELTKALHVFTNSKNKLDDILDNKKKTFKIKKN